MELSDLVIFRTVARAGGITRAATQLHRVQSNVTTRVKQLEQTLGVALFLREGKRLQLSPAGNTLLAYADRLLSLAQEARDALHDPDPRGLLRLGSMESTAASRLPEPLSRYHQRYPDVTLELRTGATLRLINQVLNSELDAALVAEPVHDERLEKAVVFSEELVLIAAADHPHVRKPADVQKRTLLTFESGCAYRKRLEDWFGSARVLPERVVELSSYHAILGCAVAGMGVGFVPRSVLDGFPARGRLSIHKLSAPYAKSKTVLIWRRQAKSANVQSLLESLLA